MTKYIHNLYPKEPEYKIEREARLNGTTRIYQISVTGKEHRLLLCKIIRDLNEEKNPADRGQRGHRKPKRLPSSFQR
ncbi:hypothetical protein EBR96_11180 [bacterium]|nr:hypothetical protein [bacterium]